MAARLDTPRQIVSKWCKRLALARLPGTLIGNLGLSAQDESDIVAFLQTLSDRFLTIPAAPLDSRPKPSHPNPTPATRGPNIK